MADENDQTAGGVLRVDLGALARNWRAVAARAAPARAGAVVKADAYGLGATEVVPVLAREGCGHFFVATLAEAQEILPLLPAKAEVFVLNGLHPGTEMRCARDNIVPVLNSLDQIDAWSATARRLGRTLPAVLQADTGMSRLGLSQADALLLKESPARLEGIAFSFLMSHLAAADEPESVQNADQLAQMQAFAALFPALPVCFANSGGIFLGGAFRHDIVRPGIALYGGAAQPGDNPMEPVVRLDLRVVMTRTVPAGTKVGYSATFVAPAETRLAVLGAGYADGLPRGLSNRASAWRDGIRLPFAGRVSMDSLIVDVTSLPEGTLKTGDLVELIGPNQSLEQLAADAGTISYEILTSLGRRYERIYLRPEAAALPEKAA